MATRYYISSTDGADTNNGISVGSPWKTIAKLNASFASIVPGDTVSFKRGDLFVGSIIVGKSGTIFSPIVFNSYSTGELPIISGLTTVNSWTLHSTGIYYTSASAASNSLRIVTANSVLQEIGRYPNSDAANGGFLKYESFNSISPSIIDNQLTTTPNWTGADVVIRKNNWMYDICPVVNHSGINIIYSQPAIRENTYYGKAGYGYFFQNSLQTLDKFGEWFLNKATKQLYYFFGANNPNNSTIQFSTVDTLLNLGGANGRSARSYIVVDQLSFTGANEFAVYGQANDYITIKNCKFTFNTDAVFLYNIGKGTVVNNEVINTTNNGIKLDSRDKSGNYISNNLVRLTALRPGISRSTDEERTAIYSHGDTNVISYNRIDSVGYNGINYQGSDVKVENNYVSNVCITNDDGGCFYTYKNAGKLRRTVKNNVGYNAVGEPFGTSEAISDDARIFYFDDESTDVVCENNTAVLAAGAAFYFNNTSRITCRNNKILGTSIGFSLQRRRGGPLFRDMVIVGNFVDPIKTNIFYWNGELNIPVVTDIQSDFRAIGRIDSNYYRTGLAAEFDYHYHLTNDSNYFNPAPLALSAWKTFIANDAASNPLNSNSELYFAGNQNVSFVLDGAYQDYFNTTYNGSIALPAYQSRFIFRISDVQIPDDLKPGLRVLWRLSQ